MPQQRRRPGKWRRAVLAISLHLVCVRGFIAEAGRPVCSRIAPRTVCMRSGPVRTPGRRTISRKSNRPGDATSEDDLGDDLAGDESQTWWLRRNSVLDRIASYLEETLAEWPEESDRTVAREILRRGTVALRKLETEWKYFQSEVQSDVNELSQLEAQEEVPELRQSTRAARGSARRPRAWVSSEADPAVRRQRRQLQAALRVLQREGWRDLEEILTDAVAPEYHELVRDVIAVSREEGNGPNSTVLRRAIEIASQEVQANLQARIATARKAIKRRRAAMAAATAEIKADVREIEREIDSALRALREEWRRSVASGELTPGTAGSGAASYADLREFVERIFRRSVGGTGARPTLAELRERWRAAVNLPAISAVAADALAEAAPLTDTIVGPVQVTPASDMRADGRHVTIVTTASIPWMTGTSVNPLLRAAYLSAREGMRSVTLVLPWLAPDEQEAVFPAGLRFATPAEQEDYIRRWARGRGSLPSLEFRLAWYPAAFQRVAGSIMPTTDIVRQLPDECRDIVILEEPEHLTWSHHGTRWNHHFRHVVGVAHTNYIAYAEQFGVSTMAGSWFITALCVAAYCDVVIKLSDTLQWLPGKCLVRNVHGVRPDFLAIGARRAVSPPGVKKGAYFLGKALWAKGYRQLVDLTASPEFRAALPDVVLNCYGSGPDSDAIRAESAQRSSQLVFNGAIDHGHDSLFAYDIFVNPSTSEVLCTATAEALAMGKIVLVAEHPSNNFFKSFKNARFFRTRAEFVAQLRDALASAPEPLSAVERFTLSWEAATERLMDAAALPTGSVRQVHDPAHTLAYRVHWGMGLPLWGDTLREFSNAVPWQPYNGYNLEPQSLVVHSTRQHQAY